VLFADAPNTKFYAVPPFGCCFAPFVKSAKMTMTDFRRMFALIFQYCVMAPLFAFCLLMRELQGNDSMVSVIMAFKLFSAMSCFYGLLALLRSSNSLLKQYKIKGKFWCIKGLIVVMLLPPAILSLIHIEGATDEYSEDTLREAYGAMVSLVLLTGLSVVTLLNFGSEDALSALVNFEKSQSSRLNLLSPNSPSVTLGMTVTADREPNGQAVVLVVEEDGDGNGNGDGHGIANGGDNGNSTKSVNCEQNGASPKQVKQSETSKYSGFNRTLATTLLN